MNLGALIIGAVALWAVVLFLSYLWGGLWLIFGK